MSTHKHEWGQRISDLRFERDMTLRELAELAECSVSTLSRIERGERGVSDALKPRLAAALGVEPHEIFVFSQAA